MKLIPLTRGLFAQVDDTDYDYLMQWKWGVHKGKNDNTYYAVRTDYTGGIKKRIIMHRLVLKANIGQMVDHIDGNGLNNQKLNLRFCTPSQNQANCKRRHGNNCQSPYIGVCKKDKSWRATMTFRGKAIHIGCFSTPEEAALAYNEKAKELHGSFARLNIISL